jgi:cellulose biosynthesis protein BcsQ
MAEPIDRAALTRVVAVINGKGGVGKTTLTSNIGGLLAISGYKVLLVDMDPQGNLAEDLGYSNAEYNDDGQKLAAALSFGGVAEPVKDIRPNLDVLIGGYHLDQAAAALVARSAKDSDRSRLALATLLQPIAGDYDLVLIDCPPGNETLQFAAAAVARYALVPVKTDASSRKGLVDVARRLEGVIDLNPDLDLLGVVLVGTGTTAHRIQEDARALIAEALGNADVIFTSTVRHSEATAQASREKGVLVHELDEQVRKGPTWWQSLRDGTTSERIGPRSATSVADDLQAVAAEVVQRITSKEAQEATS